MDPELGRPSLLRASSGARVGRCPHGEAGGRAAHLQASLGVLACVLRTVGTGAPVHPGVWGRCAHCAGWTSRGSVEATDPHRLSSSPGEMLVAWAYGHR